MKRQLINCTKDSLAFNLLSSQPHLYNQYLLSTVIEWYKEKEKKEKEYLNFLLNNTNKLNDKLNDKNKNNYNK